MYKLTLEHHFAAAHQLTNAYSKECNDFLHGHNWKVIIVIRTNVLQNSMVVDFKKIKEVINKLDHKNLNEILNFEPTAENISKYLYDEIMKIRDQIRISVEVFETDKASIKYQL